MDNKWELYNKTINYFGESKQTLKLIEEMAELQKELIKGMLSEGDNFDREKIESEIADVSICLEQHFMMFNQENIQDKKEKKLDRLKDMIEE